MSDTRDTDQRWWSTNLSRRTLLRGSILGGAGLAAAALIGCGGDDDDDDDTVAQPTATTDDAAGDDAADDTPDEPDFEGPYPSTISDPPGTPKKGGIFKLGHTISVQTIDPITSAAGGTVTVPNVVYDRLVGHKSGFDVGPDELSIKAELASDWELSQDGLTLTFNLRDDVTWQNVDPVNGRPFTAADVKFAYERYQTDLSVHKGLLRKITSIDAVDDTTVTLNLSEPWPDALTVLGSRFLTIFPKELVDNDTIDRNAVGTGPMILTDLLDDRSIFERNPDYWRQEVLLDGMEILSIPDLSTRLARFRVGQIDHAISLLPDLAAADKLIETNPDVRIRMSTPNNVTFTIALNLNNPKYEDERVRQALQMGIDRQLLIDLVYDGLGFGGPVMPWIYHFDAPPAFADMPFYAHNPDEGRKLLAAAGAEGMEIDLIYFNYTPSSNENQNVIIAESYAEMGVDLSPQAVDYTQFNSAWIPADYEDAADGWVPQGQAADNWWFDHLHSTSPANRWHINDPDIDAWAEAQSAAVDPEARKEIWLQIRERMLDKAYRITKTAGNGFEAYQPWVRGAAFWGALGANASYYDWGEQIANIWLDK